MVRCRSLFVVLALAMLAPAGAQTLANEPPDYFVDIQFEKKVWNDVPDGSGDMVPVAGPMAYTYNPTSQEGFLATWHTNASGQGPDTINILAEDVLAPEGFKYLRSLDLPSDWWGHDFHRQWMEMTWDYLVVAGWSPTLQHHKVLVYTHVAAGTSHNWFLTYDFSQPPDERDHNGLVAPASTGNAPIDDIAVFGDHIAVASQGSVQIFWDNCATLQGLIDGAQSNVPALPPPLPPVPPIASTTGFVKGNCWIDETQVWGGPTYTQDGHVALRFWQSMPLPGLLLTATEPTPAPQGSMSDLYLVVVDPQAPNGEDPGNSLRDLPKGIFSVWNHDADLHSWAPIPMDLNVGRPHDKACLRGSGWGGCYHFTGTRVGGRGMAVLGDYLMVLETKPDPLNDWQMAHFYNINQTGALVYHSLTNVTMLFQGVLQHVAWSDFSSPTARVLVHAKDFYQEPFTKDPFFLEEFMRRGSLHEIEFLIEEEPARSQLTAPLEDAPHRHYTTCSFVDVVRPSGNLFHAVRTYPGKTDLVVGFAFEDNLTKNGGLYRDNRDPSVPHPFLNDVEKLHNFASAGEQECDLGVCMPPDPEPDCAGPIVDPVEPDNRDRGTAQNTTDLRERGSANRDGDDGEGDDEGGNGDGGDGTGSGQPRPGSFFPVDEDGDGVFENVDPGDNCPGVYNPVDATGTQPACEGLGDDGAGGNGGGDDDSDDIDPAGLRPESRLGPEVWVSMAIGLILVLLVFLVAKRRRDDEE